MKSTLKDFRVSQTFCFQSWVSSDMHNNYTSDTNLEDGFLQAVGEPPLFLAASVFYAIRHAVEAARNDRGLHENFRFDSPATAECIRMACQDFLTDKVGEEWREGRDEVICKGMFLSCALQATYFLHERFIITF